MRRIVLTATLTLGLLGSTGRDAGAQDHPRWAQATWVDDLNFLSANALLGGLTAGIGAKIHGRSFLESFTKGALGGATAYAGKRVATMDFSGAGLLGREIGAVGGSITLNAMRGIGPLDTLRLPVGPVWAVFAPERPGHSQLRLDLQAAAWLAYGFTESRLRIDWSGSLSSGAAVFRTRSRIRAAEGATDGVTVPGMIVLSQWTSEDSGQILAHERAHILQSDYMQGTVGLALEDWAKSFLGLEHVRLFRYVLTGVAHEPFHYLISGPWGRERDLLEVEAEFLEVR